MRYLLAIDPGVRTLGVAMFKDGALDRAAISRGHCIEDHLINLGDWAAHEVALESMVWRPGDAKSSPNDLLSAQLVGACVAGHLTTKCRVHLYPPGDWKASVPKKVHHMRIRAALEPSEIETLDYAAERTPLRFRKEILDAVGIGLYHFQRTDRAGRRL